MKEAASGLFARLKQRKLVQWAIAYVPRFKAALKKMALPYTQEKFDSP